MFTLTTTIQEITLTANAHGVFDYLFNDHNMSRDEILNIFEDWGKEYEELAQKHEGDDDWFYYDEMDGFVDFKFTDIKLEDMFPAGIALGDYLTYEGRLFKITGFCHSGILVDEVKSCKENERQAISEISFDNVRKVKLVEYEEIMDTTNGHDPELVRKINQAWNEKREQFCPILRALYARDIDEITDADSFQIDMWRPDKADGCRDEIIEAFNHGNETGDWKRYNELALEDMCRQWDECADNYLMHVADDLDLRTILTFLRYNV